MPRFGSTALTAESQPCAFCREILPHLPPASTTGAKWWEAILSSKDSNNYWSHGFIWQHDVTTDLNTLIPADSNLFIIAASNINERGQISGMATVQAGPHKGEIHAYLLTPVDGCLATTSMADFARTHTHFIFPANAGNHSSQRLGPGRLAR